MKPTKQLHMRGSYHVKKELNYYFKIINNRGRLFQELYNSYDFSMEWMQKR